MLMKAFEGQMMRRFISIAGLALAACQIFAATYTYDAGGRVTKIDYGATGAVVYGYDAAGNMVTRTVIPSASSSVIQTVNTTSGGSDIAQNTFIEIYGQNLVPANTPAAGVIWSTAPSFAQGQMPTSLNNVSVTINGKNAYIYFFCSAATSAVCKSDQINVLTPLDSATGPVSIVVNNNGSPSAPFTANMKGVNPTFIRFGGTSYVAATHLNNSLIGPTTLYPGASTPAASKEIIQIYAVGFGPVTPALTQGASPQSGSLGTLPVCKVGNNPASLLFAGLAGNGLYQIDLTIPDGTPSGDNSISCTYNGAGTAAGNLITIQ